MFKFKMIAAAAAMVVGMATTANAVTVPVDPNIPLPVQFPTVTPTFALPQVDVFDSVNGESQGANLSVEIEGDFLTGVTAAFAGASTPGQLFDKPDEGFWISLAGPVNFTFYNFQSTNDTMQWFLVDATDFGVDIAAAMAATPLMTFMADDVVDGAIVTLNSGLYALFSTITQPGGAHQSDSFYGEVIAETPIPAAALLFAPAMLAGAAVARRRKQAAAA